MIRVSLYIDTDVLGATFSKLPAAFAKAGAACASNENYNGAGRQVRRILIQEGVRLDDILEVIDAMAERDFAARGPYSLYGMVSNYNRYKPKEESSRTRRAP